MVSVEAGITEAIFKFSGQTEMDTWELKEKMAGPRLSSFDAED